MDRCVYCEIALGLPYAAILLPALSPFPYPHPYLFSVHICHRVVPEVRRYSGNMSDLWRQENLTSFFTVTVAVTVAVTNKGCAR